MGLLWPERVNKKKTEGNKNKPGCTLEKMHGPVRASARRCTRIPNPTTLCMFQLQLHPPSSPSKDQQ